MKTYKISEIAGKYKTQGRTTLLNETLIMQWSASGIEFNAECGGDVLISFNTMRLENTSESGGAYFSVLIDGIMQYADIRIPADNSEDNWRFNSTGYPFHIKSTGKSSFIIAQNLAFGKHKFEIYNQTEAKWASYGICEIALSGEITAPPQDKKIYIEFVGDSVTAGLGNIVKKSKNSPAEIPMFQDALRAWPYLTAKKLNADWSVVAVSGIPACEGLGYFGGVSMLTVYPKKLLNGSSEYKSLKCPDVAVIGLGTNDVATYKVKGKSIDYLKTGFYKTAELIRRKNPNTKIIWIYGMITSDANEIIIRTIEEKGGADNDFYSLALPKNTDGGNGHPGLDAQEIYANAVADYILECIKRK